MRPIDGRARGTSLGQVGLPVAVLLVALVLAGCLTSSNDVSETADGDDLPALSSFADCDWDYPNGEAVPCDPQISPLTVEDEPPASWVCVKSPRETWNVYESPEGEFGLYYNVSQADHLELLFRNLERPRFFHNWSDDAKGFVRLGDGLDENEEFVFVARQFNYSFTSEVADGEPRIGPLWSWYDQDTWVVHEVKVNGTAYTFQRVQLGESYYDYTVNGTDFRFETQGKTWIKDQVFPRTFGPGFRDHCPDRI